MEKKEKMYRVGLTTTITKQCKDDLNKLKHIYEVDYINIVLEKLVAEEMIRQEQLINRGNKGGDN